MYIHSVGFCVAYSRLWVFSGPLSADKQERESAFFIGRIRHSTITNSQSPITFYPYLQRQSLSPLSVFACGQMDNLDKMDMRNDAMSL